MITTQKLILTVFLINLLVGMVGEIYINPSSLTNTQLNTEISITEQHEQDFMEEEGWLNSVKSTVSQLAVTIGSPIRWGWTILRIFARGVNPFSISANSFDTQIEKQMVNGLILFRCMLVILLIFEAYMLIKNSKQS